MGTTTHADVLVVFITCPVDETAPKIARLLVENALAACVNIIPSVRSIYSWQGALQDEQEALLVVKTTGDRFEALAERVRQEHPYEVAEIIALPLAAGSPLYLQWVADSVSG